MSEFKDFKKLVEKQFTAMIANGERLFVTDIEKDLLWESYIESYPAGTNEIYRERGQHDCSACRYFVKNYGNIVTIRDNGLVSIWDIGKADSPYSVVSEKMAALVKGAPIRDIFVTKFQGLGTDTNKELLEDGSVITWNHLYFNLPKSYVDKSSSSIDAVKGVYRDTRNVFKRSMEECTLDAGNTILELINQGSLYRGEEFKETIAKFISLKVAHDKLPDEVRENWYWLSCSGPVGRIRNSAIGTLLIDLSEGVDLDTAVTKFEKVMAPTNYKRPKAIFTKKMVEEAEEKIKEMGYMDSLGRKFAALEDITVNNVLFVNRDARKRMAGSIFDDLKDEVAENPKSFNKVEEVKIEDFIKNILPTTKSIEILVENRHKNNFMSLVAPENREAPAMLKWDNNFSWSYAGDIADSMKQRVKNAGGNVDGVLRFSIQWNDGDNNQNDFDAHCIEPNGNEIEFGSKGRVHPSTGMLDVDIITPGNSVAVENITWTDEKKMFEGRYKFFVRNFSHCGGRTGFSAEIEYDGEISSYDYPHELKQKEDVVVAEVEFSRANGIKFIKALDSTVCSKEIWGVKTNNFVKVNVFMLSPNYWDGQEGKGNKHYFFFIDDCKNDTPPRGFYNEFLNDGLMKHKRVFEALGARMRVEPADNQLSGLGFSSTQRNSVIAKIEGNFKRTIKIVF